MEGVGDDSGGRGGAGGDLVVEEVPPASADVTSAKVHDALAVEIDEHDNAQPGTSTGSERGGGQF